MDMRICKQKNCNFVDDNGNFGGMWIRDGFFGWILSFIARQNWWTSEDLKTFTEIRLEFSWFRLILTNFWANFHPKRLSNWKTLIKWTKNSKIYHQNSTRPSKLPIKCSSNLKFQLAKPSALHCCIFFNCQLPIYDWLYSTNRFNCPAKGLR